MASAIRRPEAPLFPVDGTPIRIFHNAEHMGLPYPKNQPMRLYSSLWSADDWVTRGGLVRPTGLRHPSRHPTGASPPMPVFGRAEDHARSWWSQSLDAAAKNKLEWVRKSYMIYSYCTDCKRFPQGFPAECSLAI